MKSTFNSDTRGLGGQKQVFDMMSNHYSALVNVKSTMNTREKPFTHVKRQKRPQTAAKAKPQQEKKEDDQWLEKLMTTEFGEQRETFRRCTNAKTELGQFRNPGYKAQVKRLQQNKRANSGNYQM